METLLFVTMVAACGGGDDGGTNGGLPDATTGVPRSTLVNALSAAEITTECKMLLHDYPQKTEACSDGDAMIGFATQSACVTNLTGASGGHPDCQATVGDIEDCLSMEYELPSNVFCNQTDQPISCARLASADCGG